MTDGTVSVQTASPESFVVTGAGHVSNRPAGPLVGARSVQDNPDTGASFDVAWTVTVNVSPGASSRGETVTLSMKLVAILAAIAVAVASEVTVAVAEA